MVVSNLDIVRVAVAPGETDGPLVVDADAVLPETIALQLLESIARRNGQIFERRGGLDEKELL
jgi:hypothetical protein